MVRVWTVVFTVPSLGGQEMKVDVHADNSVEAQDVAVKWVKKQWKERIQENEDIDEEMRESLDPPTMDDITALTLLVKTAN